MSEAPSKPESGEEQVRTPVRRLHLLFEVLAYVALVGAVLWFAHNYQPRSIIGRGLVNYRLWLLVLLVSAWGTAGSLIPYYVGQRGTKAVFEHYPRLRGRPWERLEALYQKWGALALILSGIPALGTALLVAAGACGIGRRAFLIWVFLGKVLRYWVVVFIVLLSMQLLG